MISGWLGVPKRYERMVSLRYIVGPLSIVRGSEVPLLWVATGRGTSFFLLEAQFLLANVFGLCCNLHRLDVSKSLLAFSGYVRGTPGKVCWPATGFPCRRNQAPCFRPAAIDACVSPDKVFTSASSRA
jgi:hypothetical protein